MSIIAWWGLRAIKRSMIGRNAVRLRRSSDNAEADWPTIAGGGLDIEAIRLWGLTNKLNVVTLYDQAYTGSPDAAYNWGQTFREGQPELRLNGPGGRPTIVFNGEQYLQMSSFVDIPQPLYMNVVARRTRVTALQQVLLNFRDMDISYSSASGLLYTAGGAINPTASEQTYHAISLLYDGSNSKFMIDGAITIGGAITNTIQNLSATLGCFVLGGFFFTGELVEAGVFTCNSSVDPFHFNQREYWGI